MRKLTWKDYLLWIGITEAVGALAGFLIRDSVEIYSTTINKPPLSPPAILFPIVWSILYALMGIGAARIAAQPDSPGKNWAINLFIVQLVFNFFWSLIFFNAMAFGFAFIWLLILWVLIIGMIFAFYKQDPLAALLQIPYLLWVTFAAYLNLGVWLLNR